MKYKIKKEFLTNFKSTDFIGIFDLMNSAIFNQDFQFFDKWLADKKHADMKFLEKNFNVRKDPSLILQNAKTAIVFLFPYAHGHRVRGKRNDSVQMNIVVPEIKPSDDKVNLRYDNVIQFDDNAQAFATHSIIKNKLISKYVYVKDYHKIIKKNLAQYALDLQEKLNLKFEYRPIVDSVPFFERAYGRETGLGFIGKNTLLIRPGVGSFFFIGTLLIDLDISFLAEADSKKNPILSLNCGSCTRCIDACPTQAIEDNFTLNANKCLSYLTIEHRDIVPTTFLKKLDKTIYGCDICQDVCPYNFVTQDVSMLLEFKNIHEPLLTLTAEQIATMTEQQYEKWFGGTAMTRARYEGLVRNSLYYLFANKSAYLPCILESLKNSTYPLIQKTVNQLFSESVVHESII